MRLRSQYSALYGKREQPSRSVLGASSPCSVCKRCDKQTVRFNDLCEYGTQFPGDTMKKDGKSAKDVLAEVVC